MHEGCSIHKVALTWQFGSYRRDWAGLFESTAAHSEWRDPLKRWDKHRSPQPPPLTGRPRPVGTFVCGQYTRRKRKQKLKLTVGAWIVQTLIYHDDAERPHRRTALVSWELDNFNFSPLRNNICWRRKVGAKYTFFWKGQDAEEQLIQRRWFLRSRHH